ncbi:MAG: hypothetical protein DMF23_04820 [Verrucomicrobia bacterium]|nr:MAG: hypothetical protein DMF23_04820 [Verrucomicrobiota bacterium]
MRWRNLFAVALLLVGLTQMAGDILGNRVLKGLGAAPVAAPCPKVFCDIDGLEPFASSFTITANRQDHVSFAITPELYSRLKGPYNRRNVYGAAIAAAPRLPEPIRRAVLGYAFATNGPLRAGLALSENAPIALTIQTNTRGRSERWTFPCDP